MRLHQAIIANIGISIRRETLRGRECLVVPVAVLRPGVLNGSAGPIYYPAEENAASVARWNGVPIVLNHPYKDGKPVSARTPDILNNYCVGTVLNTVDKAGRTVAEAWIDIESANAVDQRIVANLEAGLQVEVSTGLEVKAVKAPEGSAYGNAVYNYTATDYQPDHLAILLDAVGACSIDDGCGMLVNKHRDPEMDGGFVTNELSHDQLRHVLRKQLESRVTQADPPVFIDEVYDGFVIYEQDGKLWKQSYSVSDNAVTFSGEPVRVRRETDFVPVAVAEQDNPSTEDYAMSMTNEQKAKAVDDIIGNCDCYSETDRDVLNKLSDKGLERLVANSRDDAQKSKQPAPKQPVSDPPVRTPSPDITPEEPVKTQPAPNQPGVKPVANAQPQTDAPKTTEDWLKEAPEDVRRIFNNALQVEQQERESIVGDLVINTTEEDREEVRAVYNGMALEDLRRLKKALPPAPKKPAQRDYSSQSVTTGITNLKSNATCYDDLPIPPSMY